MLRDDRPTGKASVELYWLPLGAASHSVRLNGMVYEAISSLTERRPRCDVYHSARHPCINHRASFGRCINYRASFGRAALAPRRERVEGFANEALAADPEIRMRLLG